MSIESYWKQRDLELKEEFNDFSDSELTEMAQEARADAEFSIGQIDLGQMGKWIATFAIGASCMFKVFPGTLVVDAPEQLLNHSNVAEQVVQRSEFNQKALGVACTMAAGGGLAAQLLSYAGIASGRLNPDANADLREAQNMEDELYRRQEVNSGPGSMA